MTTQEQIKELHARVETLRRCLDIDGKRGEVAAKEAESQAAKSTTSTRAKRMDLSLFFIFASFGAKLRIIYGS